MGTVRLSETLIELDGKVRVESGPTKKTGIATKELLDDAVTAKHYKHNTHLVGKVAINPKTGVVDPLPELGAVDVYRDAHGTPIFEGEEIVYLDWLGVHIWHVYQLDDAGVWQKVAEYPTEAEAIVEATKLVHGVAE